MYQYSDMTRLGTLGLTFGWVLSMGATLGCSTNSSTSSPTFNDDQKTLPVSGAKMREPIEIPFLYMSAINGEYEPCG